MAGEGGAGGADTPGLAVCLGHSWVHPLDDHSPHASVARAWPGTPLPIWPAESSVESAASLGQNQGLWGAGRLPMNQGGTGRPQGPGRPDTPGLCSQQGKSPGPRRGGGRAPGPEVSPPFGPPLPGSGSQPASSGRHVAWPLSAGVRVLLPSPHPPRERTVSNVQLRTEQMGWSLESGPPSAQLMS